eukprot:scaffold281549_cov36-Tisochrysis_lutea.AAC.2
MASQAAQWEWAVAVEVGGWGPALRRLSLSLSLACSLVSRVSHWSLVTGLGCRPLAQSPVSLVTRKRGGRLRVSIRDTSAACSRMLMRAWKFASRPVPTGWGVRRLAMPEGKSLRLTDGQRAPRSREGRLERPGGGGGRLHLHHGSCELSTKYKCKLSCACVLQCTKQNTDQRRLNIDVFTRMCRCFTNYNTALTVDGEGQTQSAHKVRTGELDGRHQ